MGKNEMREERAPFIVKKMSYFSFRGRVHESFVLVGFYKAVLVRDLCWLGIKYRKTVALTTRHVTHACSLDAR